MTTKEIGDLGERAAANCLINNGYTILKRNFRLKFAEVDIIAEKDGCTVFAEVKTRATNRFGTPGEYVDYRKQRRIQRAASCCVDIENTEIRFDVIEVLYDEKNGDIEIVNINHIENAF